MKSVIAATGFWMKYIKSGEMPNPYQGKYSRTPSTNGLPLVSLMNMKK